MLAALAECERELIVERINAGFAAARANGTRFGRPLSDPAVIADKLRIVADARAKGRTAEDAARLVGWSRATRYRHRRGQRRGRRHRRRRGPVTAAGVRAGAVERVQRRSWEQLDELGRRIRAEDRIAEDRIVRISNSFRLQETDEYTVEVWKMLYNWRKVVMPLRKQIETTRGYYYVGADLTALARAVAVGMD